MSNFSHYFYVLWKFIFTVKGFKVNSTVASHILFILFINWGFQSMLWASEFEFDTSCQFEWFQATSFDNLAQAENKPIIWLKPQAGLRLLDISST